MNKAEADKPIKYACPDWGYKADLTEEFLAQTMTINGVKYHRHRNGGGWVSEKAKVEDTVWVGVFAVVHNGVAKDKVIISDRAVINCDSLQEGADSNLSDSAWVFGSARVSGSARVFDSAWVSGNGYLKKSTSTSIELKNWEIVE